jgi:hypothetical protein
MEAAKSDNNRDKVQDVKDKSQDDYEKNLVLITSGTLVLSMTFIEKISPLEGASGIWFLIGAWVLLVISLLLNLYSHQLAGRYADECMENIDKGIAVDEINACIKINNKKITSLNNWTMALMISGIIALVVYCSINVYNMSKLPAGKKAEPPKEAKVRVVEMKNGRHVPVLPPPTTAVIKPRTTKNDKS